MSDDGPAVDEPWLSSEQQAIWRTFRRMTGELNERIERNLQRTAGMPHTYFTILVMLSEAPNRSMRMNQLATAAQSSQSRLSHAVARLEERGWVRRSPSPGDRRGQLARLTDAGYDQLVLAAPDHARTVRAIVFESLSPEEQKEFGRLCGRIIDAMAEG
jgi:DNA-binding MarR family transcriptional regulator